MKGETFFVTLIPVGSVSVKTVYFPNIPGSKTKLILVIKWKGGMDQLARIYDWRVPSAHVACDRFTN